MQKKVIVLTRGTTQYPDANLWQGTWVPGWIDKAKVIARKLQDDYPDVKFRLRYMSLENAELLEEKYRDYASDVTPW